MNLLNFMYDLTNSDLIYYILIVLLIIISLAMLYLMYSQNKELSRQMAEKAGLAKEEKVVSIEEASPFKQIESLDGREELLEVSKMTIPKHLEYTQTLFSNTELEELQTISKEIEDNYKDRQSDINVYEEEQEESAIISYDELLSKTQVIPKIEEENEVKSSTYKHEEDFLSKLKDLNNNLK